MQVRTTNEFKESVALISNPNLLLKDVMPFFKSVISNCLFLFLALSVSAQDKPAPQPQAPTKAPARKQSLGDKANPTLEDVNTYVGVDKRVIVMMAALNVAGYDHETNNRALTELRQMIRADLKDLNPTIARRLRDHYLAHRQGRGEVQSVAAGGDPSGARHGGHHHPL